MSFVVWSAFVLLILGLLAFDLGVVNRKAHIIRTREALCWTGFWVSLALLFNVFVYFAYEHHWLQLGLRDGVPLGGKQAAIEFLTAYLVEESLSVDNVFVIALILSYFAVPAAYQHRVLFWGILGAIVMRGTLILAGAALLERFSWVSYLLGALLIVSALKLLFSKQESLDPESNPLVQLVRRFMPITTTYEGPHFFVRRGEKWVATPMFLVLVLIESTDLMFAVDSVPACLAVTRDPFIVFTSNVFAILGLRSMYFALAGMLDRLRYLKFSLVFVLGFVGVKMILAHHYKIPVVISLGIIATILATGVIASLLATARQAHQPTKPGV